jgi:hypothetical protein
LKVRLGKWTRASRSDGKKQAALFVIRERQEEFERFPTKVYVVLHLALLETSFGLVKRNPVPGSLVGETASQFRTIRMIFLDAERHQMSQEALALFFCQSVDFFSDFSECHGSASLRLKSIG